MRVLVLEDHEDTRDMLSFMLRKAGHEVIACPTAEDAARCIVGKTPDLAVLDIMLPGETGDEFGRQLKQRSPQAKIVFVTGELELDHLKEIIPDCVVLPKPMDVRLFRQAIERLSRGADG